MPNLQNDISTFTYEENLRPASPLENGSQVYGHYAYLSEGSNLSSLYGEEQLNASGNLAGKLHHHNENISGAGYQHHFKSNGPSNKGGHHSSAAQATNNFNQIDHKNECNEPKLTSGSRIGKGHHLLLKNDASSDADSNSNTLIDSDVSNSSNSFASS